MERKYKLEDAIELNEENIINLYQDCLASEETDPDYLRTVSFAMSPNVPKVSFDDKKIYENAEKINYLYGQLYFTHFCFEEPLSFNPSIGCMDYNKKPWTKEQSILFAFYYLGVSNYTIALFNNSNSVTRIVKNDVTIPTLSPNDPKFEEWAKVHIED